MTEAEARAHIERLSAHDFPPELSTDDIDAIMVLAKRVDANGVNPDDDGWEPTWDLNFALASAWETKAARAAGNFRFEEDQQAFYREQVYRQCRQNADRYNKGMIAVPIVGAEA